MDSFFINSEKQIPKEGDKVVNVTLNSKGTGYLIRFADCVTGQDKLIAVAVKDEDVMQYSDMPEIAKMDVISQDRQRMLDLAIRCGAITNDELRLECGLERTGTDWGCQLAVYGNAEPLQ